MLQKFIMDSCQEISILPYFSNQGPLRFYGCGIHQIIAGQISLDFLKGFFQGSFHDEHLMSRDALSLFLQCFICMRYMVVKETAARTIKSVRQGKNTSSLLHGFDGKNCVGNVYQLFTALFRTVKLISKQTITPKSKLFICF